MKSFTLSLLMSLLAFSSCDKSPDPVYGIEPPLPINDERWGYFDGYISTGIFRAQNREGHFPVKSGEHWVVMNDKQEIVGYGCNPLFVLDFDDSSYIDLYVYGDYRTDKTLTVTESMPQSSNLPPALRSSIRARFPYKIGEGLLRYADYVPKESNPLHIKVLNVTWTTTNKNSLPAVDLLLTGWLFNEGKPNSDSISIDLKCGLPSCRTPIEYTLP